MEGSSGFCSGQHSFLLVSSLCCSTLCIAENRVRHDDLVRQMWYAKGNSLDRQKWKPQITRAPGLELDPTWHLETQELESMDIQWSVKDGSSRSGTVAQWQSTVLGCMRVKAQSLVQPFPHRNSAYTSWLVFLKPSSVPLHSRCVLVSFLLLC